MLGHGGLAEWSIASVSKTEVSEKGPQVRILHPPPWCGVRIPLLLLRTSRTNIF